MSDRLAELVLELAEAVDNAAADIGGSRPQLDILRDAVQAANSPRPTTQAEQQLAQAVDLLDQATSYTSKPAWSPSMTEEIERFVEACRVTKPAVAAEAGQMTPKQRLMGLANGIRLGHCPDTELLAKRMEAIADALATQPAPPSQGQTAAARDVLAERQRQVSDLGWTSEHDDDHDSGELSAAASSYAITAADVLHPQSQGDGGFIDIPPISWPWDGSWWRPGADPRRMLVKAGALILAEIERLDRAAPTQPPAEGEQ